VRVAQVGREAYLPLVTNHVDGTQYSSQSDPRLFDVGCRRRVLQRGHHGAVTVHHPGHQSLDVFGFHGVRDRSLRSPVGFGHGQALPALLQQFHLSQERLVTGVGFEIPQKRVAFNPAEHYIFLAVRSVKPGKGAIYFATIRVNLSYPIRPPVCMRRRGPCERRVRLSSATIHVSTQGLDLSHPADTQTVYTHLKRAAWVACTTGNRVGLVPSDNPGGCSEKALAGAIRSASVPTLTQIYLANHTLQEAVAFGILVPAQIAAK